MKRIRELITELRTKYPSDNFFANFESSCLSEPAKRKHYRSYNDALMLLDKDSWEILKAKAIEQFGNHRAGQLKQGFFNQLNEAFAYRYLLRRRFKSIRFIPEATKKTPDIRFTDGGKESYCEVKTMGISNDEINRRKGGVYSGTIYLDLSPGFLNKLKDAITLAWEQIHSLGPTGLVFILIRFDDIALDHYSSRYRKQLTKFCQSQGYKDLVFKIGHRGNRYIRNLT
jgi:hypothetical protein